MQVMAVTCQIACYPNRGTQCPVQITHGSAAACMHMQRPQQLSSSCERRLCCWDSCLLCLSVLLAVSCCPQVSTAAAASVATSQEKHTPSSHQRHLKQQSSGTSWGGSLFAPPLLPVSNSSAYPFSAVGQLANGCSAFLISPCHVMTVAHCVVEPHRKIWYHGLEFYPGRNVQTDGSGCSPLGSAVKVEVVVSPGWMEGPEKGQSQHDYAVIQLDKRLGDQHGWLQVGLPQEEQGLVSPAVVTCSEGQAPQVQPAAPTRSPTQPQGSNVQYSRMMTPGRRLQQIQQQQQPTQEPNKKQAPAGQAGPFPLPPQPQDTTPDASPITGPHQLLTNIGYPDNQRNGSMWVGYCQQFAWRYRGALLWHGCSTRGGNSGSPLFIPMQRGKASNGGSGSREEGVVAVALGLHVAALKQSVDVPAARLAAADMSSVVHASTCSSQLYNPCHQLPLTSVKATNNMSSSAGRGSGPWWYQQLMPTVQEQLLQPSAQQQLQKLRDSGACGGSGSGPAFKPASEPLLEAGMVHEPVAAAFTPELQSWVQGVVNTHKCGG